MISELPVVLGTKYGQHPEVATFAVEEAIRREVGLRVVHASTDPAASRVLFDEVEQILAARGGRLSVDFRVIDGDAADVLLDEAQLASAVVVGADDAPWVARTIGMEISQRVAAGAEAPVIVVPRTTLARHPSGVVAALDFSGEVEDQLAYALETAARQHEPLLVIYATGVTSDYPTRRSQWYHLEDTVDRWREKYPQVTIRTAVEPGHPVHTCVIASTNASVLVVGQPTGDHSWLVSRAVVAKLLRRSTAPVAVVPLGYDRVRQSP